VPGIAGAVVPSVVKPWQPIVQEAGSGAEYVHSLPAQNIANELPAMAGLPNNLPDGRTIFCQFPDRVVGLLPA
jgi:hypothetical protein